MSFSFNTPSINFEDAYWVVAGSVTQVFSSRRLIFVVVADTAYVAWLALGNLPIPVATAAILTDTMLDGCLYYLLEDGYNLVSTGTPALNGAYDADAFTMSLMGMIVASMAAGNATPSGAANFNYPDASGVQHSFTKVQFNAMYGAMVTYYYNLVQVIVGNTAGGSTAIPSSTLTIA